MRLEHYRLADHVFGSVRDAQKRNIYTSSGDFTAHTTLAVSNTVTTEGLERGRLAYVQAVLTEAAVSDLTIQVQVNGRDVFEDSERPTIPTGETSSPVVPVPIQIPYQRGDPIASIIEVVGVQTGELEVLFDTEPWTLLKRPQGVTGSARSRFKRELSKASREPAPPRRKALVALLEPPQRRERRSEETPDTPSRRYHRRTPPRGDGGIYGGGGSGGIVR